MRRGGAATRRAEFTTGGLYLNLQTNPRTGVTVGYKERAPGYTHVADSHDFWELLYVDKGLVQILLNRAPLTVSQGEFLIIAPNQLHGVMPSGTIAPFYITAHFETNLEGLADLTDTIVKIDEEGRQLLIGLLEEYASNRIASRELARCYLAEFLIKAVRRGAGQGCSTDRLPTYFQANAEEQRVRKAVDYMRVARHRPLKLQDIAREVGLSQSYLEHIFKKHTGRSVMSFLQELRIESAKKFLLESTLNISQIAERCGYSSIYLFSRRFKKFVSLSPSQYARMVRPALADVNKKDLQR